MLTLERDVLTIIGNYLRGAGYSRQPVQVHCLEHVLRLIDAARPDIEADSWPIDHIHPPYYEGGRAVLRFGTKPPYRLLYIDRAAYKQLKQRYAHAYFAKADPDQHRVRPGRWLMAMVLTVLGLAALLWFSLPRLLDYAVGKIEVEKEVKLGNLFYKQMAPQLNIDSVASQRLQTFANRLQLKGGYPYQLHVVHGDEVNAFAMPGGHIVVYDALLKQIDSKEELAALLGHESAHVHRRHTLRQMARQGTLLMTALLIFPNSDMAAYMSRELMSLKFSRDFEREADAEALAFLQQQGLNQQGFVQLMQRLQKVNDQLGDSDLTEYLTTHPSPESRIEAAQEIIGNSQGAKPASTICPQLQHDFNQLKQVPDAAEVKENW